MGVGFKFGKDLSEKLFSTFKDAQRDIQIVQSTGFDPINEIEASLTFTGKCIRTKFDGSSFENQNILDAEFALKVKASEVKDDVGGNYFEVRQDNCTCKVQDIDPDTFADLGLVSCEILAVMKDGVDAVYTIVAKRS